MVYSVQRNLEMMEWGSLVGDKVKESKLIFFDGVKPVEVMWLWKLCKESHNFHYVTRRDM